MFIYFEFDQHYRKKIADCFDVEVEYLDEFFSDLESEVGWYIALGGLRGGELSAQEALTYLEELFEKSNAFYDALKRMPNNIWGWLVESVPMGTNYREPFQKIPPLLQQIVQITYDAVGKIDPEAENISQVTSMDLIKRMGRCYDDHSEIPIDMRTDSFASYVEIVFEAIGSDEDPKEAIQNTIDSKEESAALASKNAASPIAKRKPFGRNKN